VLFGLARARGKREIWATGAFGSNHALANALHAPRAGLAAGSLLFPQPISRAALENLWVLLGTRAELRTVAHWSLLPFGIFLTARRCRHQNRSATIMVPGGATPEGALGYVSAALELARQVADGLLPRPERVVIGVGSTCTSAGLLVGFEHAARLGIGFVDAAGRPAPPELVAVRVTPWPVTAHFRIVGLAARASRLLARLASDPRLEIERRVLGSRLRVDDRFLGRGYGHPTESGRRALELFRASERLLLDTTYSAKSAAAFLAAALSGAEGPTLFWSTKSTAPLPEPKRAALEAAPPRAVRWLARAERLLANSGELPSGFPAG
jgi:D-cysteine desulfhydrase